MRASVPLIALVVALALAGCLVTPTLPPTSTPVPAGAPTTELADTPPWSRLLLQPRRRSAPPPRR